MKQIEDNHDDCPTCLPWEFKVEVDLEFLRMAKDYYRTLNRIKPNYYTTKYHGDLIDRKIKEVVQDRD